MLDAVLALNETDTKVFDFASQAAPPADEPAGHITVPNAHLLFNGDFQRVGTNDLKIVGDDGASFFIRDYFAADKLSHLISPEGATLSASVVAALAGPLAPGQSAQAGAQQAGQPVIGRVDALSGSCTVVRNGVSVALNIGDTVRKGDVVQTAGGSAVAIVFADGSTFSLNANARMVLDEFVYNAGGAGNSALISWCKAPLASLPDRWPRPATCASIRRWRPWASAAPRCWWKFPPMTDRRASR